MLSAVWGIISLWRYQVAAIMHLAFGGSLMLVQPTGPGKYLVMHGSATLLMNVTLMIIPLIALGAEQTIRDLRSKNITAFHLEELRAVEKRKLISFLGGLKKGKHRVVMFASP